QPPLQPRESRPKKEPKLAQRRSSKRQPPLQPRDSRPKKGPKLALRLSLEEATLNMMAPASSGEPPADGTTRQRIRSRLSRRVLAFGRMTVSPRRRDQVPQRQSPAAVS